MNNNTFIIASRAYFQQALPSTNAASSGKSVEVAAVVGAGGGGGTCPRFTPFPQVASLPTTRSARLLVWGQPAEEGRR